MEYITLFVFHYVYSRWFLSLTLFLSWAVNKHRINLMNKFVCLLQICGGGWDGVMQLSNGFSEKLQKCQILLTYERQTVPVVSEGLKQMLPLKDLHLKFKLRLWRVHGCDVLLLLWTKEMFYGTATEWVPIFQLFIVRKLLCALESAVSVFVLVPEQILLSFFNHLVSSNRSC